MARNGSGTYSLPAGNPVATGTTISSTVHNNTLSDIATALTGSLARDGQSPPTANLPMAGYKHTGVGNATARDSYASAAQSQDSSLMWATAGGTADVITLTTSPATTAHTTGQVFRFVSSGTNTTNVTVNPNAIGAKALTKNSTAALVPGDIPSGAVCEIVYDGTQYQLIGVVADRLPKSGGTVTGDITMSGASIVEAEGAAVASASSTNIWATDGNTVHITGSTTINDFGTAPQAGAWMKLIFDSTPVLTHSANLNLNAGGSNITAAAGDIAFVYADTTTQMDVFVMRASGQPIVSTAPAAASQAEIEAAVATDKYIPPGRLKYYPTTLSSMARIAVSGGTPALSNIKNVDAITDNGVGDLTVTFSESYSSASLVVPFALVESTVTTVARTVSVRPGGIGTSSVRYICSDAAGSLVDPAAWFVGVAGDFA